MYGPHRHFVTMFVVLLLGSGLGDVRAQATGFLLGLRYDAEIERPIPYYAGDADSLTQAAYYTLYITRVGQNVQVAHRADDLLIPRGGGFIKAGSKRSVYNDWVEDFIWAAPPGTRPEVRGIQALNGENCEGHREEVILYAGADYLSLRQTTAGYCYGAPHPWYFNHLAFVPIDSTHHVGLEVDKVLGARSRRAFETQARLLREDTVEDGAYLSPPDPANWGIIRQNGRWIAIGRVELSDQIAVGDHRDLVISVDLPEELAAHNQRLIPPQLVRRIVPEATDYFTSPEGDFIVIMQEGSLSVHPLQHHTIGRRLLEVSTLNGATPVLAKWSSGGRVDTWLRQLESPLVSSRTDLP